MSIVKLLSVAGFKKKPGEKLEVVFGASDSRIDNENRKVQFMCSNAPVTFDASASARLPGGGVSLFYGFREALEETAACKDRVARFQEADPDASYGFHSAYINVEVGEIFREMAGLKDLDGLQFANIRRLKAEAQHCIMDRMSELLKKETQDLKTIHRVREIALHPHLIEPILSEPPFESIKVFVYPVQSGRPGSSVKYLAYVKPGADVSSIEQNTRVPWEMVWPH